MSLALYKLTGQLRELEGIAEEELPDEVVRDTLEALTGEIQIKATGIIALVRNQEVLADSIDEAAKAMRERATNLRKRAEWMRHYVLENMRKSGITHIDSPEFGISIQRNPPSVVIDAESAIPDRYMVTPEPPPPRPDKKLIAEALKAGKDVPGCHLEQTERLRVK